METKTLKEFLQEEAQKHDQRLRRERRDEWVAAVERLLDQCNVWLQVADEAKVLEIESQHVDKLEEGLGNYRVPSLKITLGGTAIRIVPVGRNTVGRFGLGLQPEGRVDIAGGASKFIIYRTFQEGQEHWYALDTHHWEPLLFDKERFEAIIQGMLS